MLKPNAGGGNALDVHAAGVRAGAGALEQRSAPPGDVYAGGAEGRAKAEARPVRTVVSEMRVTIRAPTCGATEFLEGGLIGNTDVSRRSDMNFNRTKKEAAASGSGVGVGVPRRLGGSRNATYAN